MKLSNHLILTTSPLSQPAKKPCGTASLTRRQRSLYGRKRHHPAVKERDSETGLYYYGARYLDSKTSRWISGDLAIADYIPSAPINDEARKQNKNLPGQGGVFNYVNLHMYHYAGNNPVKLMDPDGRMQKHADGYVVFDSKNDTIHDAWQHGGHASWKEAAAKIGVLHYYDSNGNWSGEIPEGVVLKDKVLSASKANRDAHLKANYPKIIEAETYSKISKEIKEDNSIDFSGIRDQIIGDILGSIGGSILSLTFGLATNTPDSLGTTGSSKLLRDVQSNAGALKNLRKMELTNQKDFTTREEIRSRVSDSIRFRNKPYIDD